MNNKIYISGKITGDPNYALKFEAAAVTVSRSNFFDRHGSADMSVRHGYFGFRPVDPCDFTLIGIPLRNYTWSVCIMVCLWHLAGCSYVYMLRDWKDSRGARIEHRVAKILHKEIIYQG